MSLNNDSFPLIRFRIWKLDYILQQLAQIIVQQLSLFSSNQ